MAKCYSATFLSTSALSSACYRVQVAWGPKRLWFLLQLLPSL